MSDEDVTYCRLCAEETSLDQMITTDSVDGKWSNITKKMSWINVDVSETNLLPKSICFSCFDLLEKTYDFLQTTRRAQSKLSEIYSKKIKLPLAGEIKPVIQLAETGKPVNEDFDQFKNVISSLKHEIDIKFDNDAEVVVQESLIDVKIVKQEIEDYDNDFYSNDGFNNSLLVEKNDSDSDVPLKFATKLKKSKKTSKKKKAKKKVKVKIEDDNDDLADLLPNPDAEMIPLDMSMYNASWNDYPWSCAKCDAQCKDLPSLRLHSLEIHSCCCVFKCADCMKIFANHTAFVNHVRLHRKSLRMCCDLCNKQFSLAQVVKKHRILAHKELILSSCQNCGATFDNENSLQDHILLYAKGYRTPSKRKKTTIESDLKCDVCQKEFKSKSNLVAHKQVHSERARNFSCHICGKMFFTKGTLSTHMATHEESKPYKCDFCPMAFRARGNLVSHISLHSEAKPYVCEQCGKCFRVKRHLKSHTIVHTDLMPYSCHYCGKLFRFKTRLNLHIRQHTGAKPYSCNHCLRDFTNGSNYKKHMIRRHNIDVSRKKYKSVITIEGNIQNRPVDLEGNFTQMINRDNESPN